MVGCVKYAQKQVRHMNLNTETQGKNPDDVSNYI